MSISQQFESASGKNDYIPHKSFAGVSLMHLVKGEMTEGQISSHLVKLEPFCSLNEHVHHGQFEIHQVIQGTGECDIAGELVGYVPGVVAVIPKDTPHSVTAKENGLYILASFSPALL
ncbi:MAG: cupin domain-containing protein [Coriobacteriia bacterium]|nr:cupin domain-containing protein [Coriobacteriia bacterium]